MKVKVLYDFTAQPNSSELSVKADEILTVTRQDVGEGWWEGTNIHGQCGLFPAGYVEVYSEKTIYEANQQVPHSTSSFQSNQVSSQYHRPPSASDHHVSSVSGHQASTTEEPDWPDEDWDEDDDSGDNTEYGGPVNQVGYPNANYYSKGNIPAGALDHLNSATSAMSICGDEKAQINSGGPIKPRKNFNRFSAFVKSGLESYILEGKTIQVPPGSVVTILNDNDVGIIWDPIQNPYTCAVSKHGKEKKMKGLKSYISYDITPSTNNIVVRRRYKHFDWLMQRLSEKYIVTPLPPLPEKQIAGRFQEDFVEHRRNLLQLWVNYITRHPLLSRCDVWWHFMTCNTDDMKGWKNGKRKAEKDELVGANFFFAVETDNTVGPLDQMKAAKQLDQFHRFVAKLDDAVKHMFTTTIDQSKKFSTMYSKDYRKLSESIKELASACQSGTLWRNSIGLNEALRETSVAYEEISRLHEEEPKYDFEPMADILHQYRGLLAGWPEIIQLHRDTMNKRSEQEKMLDEGKISEAILNRVNQRANVTTYATLAEINHFHDERITDFKQMMQVFLTAQINFHNDILSKLNSALDKFNDA